MKKFIGVLVLLVIGFLIVGEELWENRWRSPYKNFWTVSEARLKDIPSNNLGTLGKHLYSATGKVYYDANGGEKWGIYSIWFGQDYRMLRLGYSKKDHKELEALSTDAVKVYMGLLEFLSWSEATPGQVTIVSMYKAEVLKAAVLLSQCINVAYQNYDCYVANGGYKSMDDMWAYASSKDGRVNALLDADVTAGPMLGYVMYVLREQPTAKRLEKVPELKELYSVLDRLLALLKKWELYVELYSDKPELDNVAVDTGFFATSFPFKGY